MMKYRHTFSVNASIEEVVQFHRRSASMADITPPPVVVRVQHAPELLSSGDEMAFTLWIGPLSVPWVARIEQVTETGVIDRQIDGPFQHWVHRHTFVPLDQAKTEIRDEIETELSSFGRRWLVGLGMRLNLPVLFAYRAWKTRRLLERSGQWNAS